MEVTRKFDEPYVTLGNRVFLKYVDRALSIPKKRLKLTENFIYIKILRNR